MGNGRFGSEMYHGPNEDRFRFTPDRTGAWVYRCKEHGAKRT